MTMRSNNRIDSSVWNVIFVILAVAAASIMYHIIVMKRLEQTSLLFIGIPAVLALIVACTPKPKSAMGSVLRATTLGLLISGAFLGEGFVCILMASPLFYLVAIIIGAARNSRNRTVLPALVLVGLVPMSIEGTHSKLSFNREETVLATAIVDASATQVEQALSRSPRTDLPLPYYLRAGFPRPVEAHGSGLHPGDLRVIHFAGGEGKPGDLTMKVTDSSPGHLHLVAVSDKSKIAHWLDWEAADVRWEQVDTTHTRVTWSLSFRRLLDPAWYFRPWERYAVRLAAEYLIQANARPVER
jgi:hypothetical protein